MLDTGREYLRSGQSILLSHEEDRSITEEFEIQALVGEGATAACYEARLIRDGYYKTGKLKEFYPIGSSREDTGRPYRLERRKDGQLVAEGDTGRFADDCGQYLKTSRMLWETMQDPKHELLRNYLQIGDIFYGTGESATAYIWTPGVAGMEMEEYVLEVRKAPGRQSEAKLRNILRIIIALTKCVRALHTAGIMHLDIKPSNFILPYESYPNINPDLISMFDIDTLYALRNHADTRFVGTTGYCAPEMRKGTADNRSDIYSIGAILFRAIVIVDGIEGSGCFRDDYYDDIDVLLKNSELIIGSAQNSDNELLEMLANILKRCLAKDPDRRFEKCSDLLAALQEAAMHAALSSEMLKLSQEHNRVNPEIAIRKLLYDHPLYESLLNAGPSAQNDIGIRVLIVGSGTYGQMFLDQCLQAGQMKDCALSVVAVSDAPERDRERYLRYRPDIGRFVDIDGSMGKNAARAYGTVRFVSVSGASGGNGFVSGTEKEICEENRKLVSRLIGEFGNPARGFDYIFLALGEDDLNRNIAIIFREMVSEMRGGFDCTIAYVCEASDQSDGMYHENGLCEVCINERMSPNAINPCLEQMAFNTNLVWGSPLNSDLVEELRLFRTDPYRYSSSINHALSIKYKLYSVGILFDENDKISEDMVQQFRLVRDTEEAAQVFSDEILSPMEAGDTAAKAKFDNIVWLEHRRWVLEKVTSGWKAPRDKNGRLALEECVLNGMVRNPANHTHPCIVFSTAETPLEGPGYAGLDRSKWDDPNIDPTLDELDRMSIELHQCFRRQADKLIGNDLLNNVDMETIRHLTANSSEQVTRAYRQFRFCLQNILEGVISYTRQYAYYRSNFLDSLHEFSEDDKQQITARLDLIDRSFFPIIEANLYRDYKKYDEILARKIPFILTYRSAPEVVTAFADGNKQDGRNEAIFGNVASATVLCPQKILYLYWLDGDVQTDFFVQKFSCVLSYLREREMHCDVSLLVACSEDIPEKERTLFEIGLNKLRQEDQNRHATAAFSEYEIQICEDIKSCSEFYAGRICEMSDVLYDGSNPLFDLNEDEELFARRIRDCGVPYYQFDWRNKRFTIHEGCNYLLYLEEDSYIRIKDMFSLMQKSESHINFPEYMDDYLVLWEIYTGGKDASASQYAYSVRIWDLMCYLLQNYESAQLPITTLSLSETQVGPKEKMIYDLPGFTFHTVGEILDKLIAYGAVDATSSLVRHTSEDCRLTLVGDILQKPAYDELFSHPGYLLDYYRVQVSREENVISITASQMEVNRLDLSRLEQRDAESAYALLKKLQEGGFIRSLERKNGNIQMVSFSYSSPRIKALLTRTGEILKIYTYYEVLKTGYFDDAATDITFDLDGDGEEYDVNLLLTKGFRSVFVDCSEKPEQDTSPEFVKIVEKFGIGASGVTIFPDQEIMEHIAEMLQLQTIDTDDFDNAAECEKKAGWEMEEGILMILSESAMTGNAPWIQNGEIKEVIIEPGITKIPAKAFSGCCLERVSLPSGLTEIGDRAFSHCESLKSLELPDSIEEIGRFAFASCSSLECVKLSKGLMAIGDSSFWACSSLKEIKLPEGLKTIGNKAFSGCSCLEKINLPDTLTVIGDKAFGNCFGLKDIKLPDKPIRIGDNAFPENIETNEIRFPDSFGEHKVKLAYKTIGDTTPQNKERVYFTCHPEDFELYFDSVCKDIFKTQNCAIYYRENPNIALTEEEMEELGRMQLFMIPITERFLYKENEARCRELTFALEHHIPVLPLMQDNGLDKEFNRICGDLQFMKKPAITDDPTELSYEKKLENFLSSVLLGEELAEQVRAAFDAYIFLSYRKKDRGYAQELMRLIHRNDFCRDIAIWYDEFLVPGENFNQAIRDAMEKSDLFTFVVTPNILDSKNYVKDIEYPEAKRAGKPILPVEMVETDREMLRENFADIPDPTDAHDQTAFNDALFERISRFGIEKNDDPMHLFFIGLAYLGGIDMEVDFERAVKMITTSAEAGLPEAMEKLSQMYKTGEGVERDYDVSAHWLENFAEYWKKKYEKSGLKEDGLKKFDALNNLGEALLDLSRLPQAKDVYEEMLQTAETMKKVFDGEDVLKNLVISYQGMEMICMYDGNVSEAQQWNRKAHKISKKLRKNTDTLESWLMHSSSSFIKGGLCEAQGDLDGAKYWYLQDLELIKTLFNVTGANELQWLESMCFNGLGSLCMKQGLLGDAKTWYLNALEMEERWSPDNRTNDMISVLFDTYGSLGQIYIRLGDISSAKELFAKNLELKEELYHKTGTMAAQRELAGGYDCMAKISIEEGNTEGAKEWLQKGSEIRECLYRDTGAVEDYEELAHSHEMWGLMYLEEGNIEASISRIEKTVTMREALNAEAETLGSRMNLADGYFDMGLIFMQEGCLTEAEEWMRKSLELRRNLAPLPLKINDLAYPLRTPQVMSKEVQGNYLLNAQRDLVVSLYMLGCICEDKGETENAKQLYLESMERNQPLLLFSEVADEKENQFNNLASLARISLKEGEAEEGAKWARECLKMLETTGRNTYTLDSRMSLLATFDHLGNVSEDKQLFSEAKEWYCKELELSEKLVGETGQAEAWRFLAISYSHMGDFSRAEGNLEEAGEWYRTNLKLKRELAQETKTAEAADDLAISYYKLGILDWNHYDTFMLRQAESIWKKLAAACPMEPSYFEGLHMVQDALAETDMQN